MKITASTAAQGDPVSEGTHTLTLKELRGPKPRTYTDSSGNTIAIEQSFRLGVQVASAHEQGRMAWDTVDVDGPMGWRFTSLADAILRKKHARGEAIDTDKLLGKSFIATVKHAASQGGGVFTNLQNFTATPVVATAPSVGRRLASPAAAKKS